LRPPPPPQRLRPPPPQRRRLPPPQRRRLPRRQRPLLRRRRHPYRDDAHNECVYAGSVPQRGLSRLLRDRPMGIALTEPLTDARYRRRLHRQWLGLPSSAPLRRVLSAL